MDRSNSIMILYLRHAWASISAGSSGRIKECGTFSKSISRTLSTVSPGAQLYQKTTLVRLLKTSQHSLLSSLHRFRSGRNSHANSSAWIKQSLCMFCMRQIISFHALGGGCFPTTRLRFWFGLLCRDEQADDRSSWTSTQPVLSSTRGRHSNLLIT